MNTEPTRRSAGGSVHRLLDEAFEGVEMTPDLQDLKEEIRANLAVRADELMVDGRSPEQAARPAFDELGDLGATKTNRHKPWVLAQSADFEDRFSTDPAAAARFGIYTAVLWTAAFALFIVLSFTVGWAWSWLALVVGFLVMLVILARMLFPPKG